MPIAYHTVMASRLRGYDQPGQTHFSRVCCCHRLTFFWQEVIKQAVIDGLRGLQVRVAAAKDTTWLDEPGPDNGRERDFSIGVDCKDGSVHFRTRPDKPPSARLRHRGHSR